MKCILILFKGGGVAIEGKKVIAGAGTELAVVVKKTINAGLSGLETLSGIPGTLGGAIVGNAGAYGHSISETVKRVEVWDPFDVVQGRRRWLKGSECRFAYRESVFKHKPYLVLRAELVLTRGEKSRLKKMSGDIIRTREKKYRPGLKCPGSFFKNVLVKSVPKAVLKFIDGKKIIEGKIPAGYLLEEAGARGIRLGGIRVADFHGNLLMNIGNAKARDAKKLARLLKKRVKRKFGIDMEEEVRYF
jgi:UDP-N-acetylmuramate dehydrogenase